MSQNPDSLSLRKLTTLTGKTLKRDFRSARNLFWLLVVFLILINLVMIAGVTSAIPRPVFALAVEDRSTEVATFVGNITNNRLKDIFDFQNVSLEEGKTALGKGEVVALLHIPEGVLDGLEAGNKKSLSLFVNNPGDPLSSFLIRYTDNLTQVLNEGQNSAMIYLDTMRREGLPQSEINKRFREIQIEYLTAFLTRSTVFESDQQLDNYLGQGFIGYYFYGALLTILFISAMTLSGSMSRDLKSGLWQRLSHQGYGFWNLALSRILSTGLILTLQTLLMTVVFGLVIGKPAIPTMSQLLLYVVICLQISLMSLTFVRLFGRHSAWDWIMPSGIFFLLLTGGLVVPLPALGSGFRIMEQLHPVTLAHRYLMGASFTWTGALVFSAWFILFAGILFFAENKSPSAEFL